MYHKTALLLATCLAGVVPLAWSEQIELDRTYAVAPGGRLSVRADGGNIKVAGTDSSRVIVNIVARGSRRILDRMMLSADQSGDDVDVVAKRSGEIYWFDWGDSDIEIRIAVPRQYHVDLGTSGGNIEVSQLRGTANGKTSGGDVRIDDIQGPVTFRTSGGNIEARAVTGAVSVYTSGGDVRLTRIDGAIKARTSGGDVHVELVGANRGINVSTSGGDIVMHVASSIAATLEATTHGGRVRSDLPMTTLSSGESHLSGTINGGGETINARTTGGNILLRTHTVSTDLPLERS